MKKKNTPLAENTANNQSEDLTQPIKSGHEMTRRVAMIKVGKYAALTAATFLILTPKMAQAASPTPNPGWSENKNKSTLPKENNKTEVA